MIDPRGCKRFTCHGYVFTPLPAGTMDEKPMNFWNALPIKIVLNYHVEVRALDVEKAFHIPPTYLDGNAIRRRSFS